MRLPLSGLNHFLEALPLDTITLGVRSPICELGDWGHKYLDHSNWKEKDLETWSAVIWLNTDVTDS